MKVLVSGGSGFIAGHLIDRLCNDGFEVDSIDITIPKRKLECGEFQLKDIRQISEADSDWLKQYQVIYHLAADTGLAAQKDWLRQSREAYKTNVDGTLNLVKYADPDLFVFTSTAALYGEGRLLRETDPIKCCNAYGYSKAVAERIIEASGKRYVIYRPGTVVGSYGRTYPNRLVYERVNGVESRIFNNGLNRRSFVDVRDVVNALCVAPKIRDGIYNLSSTYETKVIDLVKIIDERSKDLGAYRPVFVDECPVGLARDVTLDNSKLIQTRHWRPLFGVDKMVDVLFNYYKSVGAIEPPEWGE